MRSIRYDLYGAAVGVGLPLVGTVIEAWTRLGSVGPAALAAAFGGQPLLWIMATTPVVLGGLGHVIVKQHEQIVGQSDELVRQSREIVRLEQARRESFQKTASELFGAAQGLLGNVSNFTSTASETAASVRETSATLHSLSQTASAAALTAETVIGIALQADRASEQGLRHAGAARSELLQLAEDVRGLSARIEELDGRLGDVVTAAGAAGPGARVPERLAQALAAAQRTMGGAVEVARLGVQRAAAGAQTATRTAETVQHLSGALKEAAQAARDIARVAQQQENGIEQVLKAMNEISLATADTMASTHEVAKEARSLNELAAMLRRAVKAGPEAAAGGGGEPGPV
jgi:methyl-accepting chemotaxis protein